MYQRKAFFCVRILNFIEGINLDNPHFIYNLSGLKSLRFWYTQIDPFVLEHVFGTILYFN